MTKDTVFAVYSKKCGESHYFKLIWDFKLMTYGLKEVDFKGKESSVIVFGEANNIPKSQYKNLEKILESTKQKGKK